MPPTISFPSLDRLWTPLVDALRREGARGSLVGTQGSLTGLALSLLVDRTAGTNASWLIVTTTDETAERLYLDLQFFHELLGLPARPLALLPEWETLPYEPAAPPVDLIARRMRTLEQLSREPRTVLVTSVRVWMQRLLPRSAFLGGRFEITRGGAIEREDLTGRLLRLGYRRASVVEAPGEFSIRGGIVDLYSTAYDEPLRVEFLGDTVESIRFFDPETQQSTRKLTEAIVLPAREFIRPVGDADVGAPIKPDAEWRSPSVYETMDTLLDYFTTRPIVVLDQPASLSREAERWWDQIGEAYGRLDHREEAATPDELFFEWPALLERTRDQPLLSLDAFAPPEGTREPVAHFPAQSPASAGLAVRGTPFTETIKILDRLRSTHRMLIVARSRGQVDRLLALFAEHDLPAERWTASSWTRPLTQKLPFLLLQGDVSTGFVSAELQLAVITEDDLFAKGTRHRPQAKTKTAAFLSTLEELNVGDYVVHVQHGIATYRGLQRLSVQEFDSDYLVLEFAGGDKLYVPLDRLNQVQRYSGGDGHVPRLDRLGGATWARTTARVKKDIEEMAQDLIDLYANRELVQRSSYAGDSTLLHEFEAAFEYEETPDQLRAIEDIKRDMESVKPMDRLVCGDVGYGKTEVAMRAAFKAVENNRQVAVLAPTTLLAQQHYENFSARFAPFPARVALLSRFQSPKEIKAVLKDLAAGTVDIAIGTHRLLQADVQFRDLGLVIIDEEQWFGVRHKERLKQLRTQVDVLTLTATPIPRTLQMAMSSVRDLSVIDTPPPGRLAIRTQVLRFSDQIVREAVMRELGRGGQVYFVHNRVETMEQMGTWLRQLVPEARIVMAHGQMSTHVLEGVMMKFFHREADVLLASAIIQSGLDIPTANTILINRADTFGLAQLYQLRGRVGRAGDQAYAYFLIPDEGTLSTDAQKRLIAIQQFTELGSGFRIAAADLEIRGAGNLLGRQQSGHIAAVGLDLYMQMVEQAVQRLKGHVVEEEPDPMLRLNLSAYIPEDYVPDAHQRLSLYKRLSSCLQLGELALLHGEMQDRYGIPPDPVERLLEVMQIRLLAKAIRLTAVEVKPASFVLTLSERAEIPEATIHRLMNRCGTRLRFLSPRSLEVQTPQPDWLSVFSELTATLQTLGVYDTKTLTSTE